MNKTLPSSSISPARIVNAPPPRLIDRRRPAGANLGYPADAPRYRRPNPSLYCKRRHQSDTVVFHATRLDLYLLLEQHGDTTGVDPHPAARTPLGRIARYAREVFIRTCILCTSNVIDIWEYGQKWPLH